MEINVSAAIVCSWESCCFIKHTGVENVHIVHPKTVRIIYHTISRILQVLGNLQWSCSEIYENINNNGGKWGHLCTHNHLHLCLLRQHNPVITTRKKSRHMSRLPSFDASLWKIATSAFFSFDFLFHYHKTSHHI